MSSQKGDSPKAPSYSRDSAPASASASTLPTTSCTPIQPVKTSKFKPPRSFASVKRARDQPTSSTPVLPFKRLSSDPETPPPSSTVQPKRPRCRAGTEKENQFSQDTPLGGVTNLINRQSAAPSPKEPLAYIDIDHDLPSSSQGSFDAAREFSEETDKQLQSRIEDLGFIQDLLEVHVRRGPVPPAEFQHVIFLATSVHNAVTGFKEYWTTGQGAQISHYPLGNHNTSLPPHRVNRSITLFFPMHRQAHRASHKNPNHKNSHP
ncbi:hypothetical protein BJ322DRAFT_34520 [Thelephora terrestris]|uniref:Uncharacterized protein n=1 Tax=Thelephora terrestris TaxID=56493 RepID=A0A9P6HQ02_9AGAM|nr:hypothetical protein BJ322DRAFT_34520 [Thelephora terrestris]